MADAEYIKQLSAKFGYALSDWIIETIRLRERDKEIKHFFSFGCGE